MPKHSPDIQTQQVDTHIHLQGVYITPFEEKDFIQAGKGAVQETKVTVNFEHVISTVGKFFASHREVIETIEYSFELNTVRRRVLDKYLDQSIMQHIDNADFVVIDWTTRNPNVLIEAGYARGRAKHGIHLSADGKIPSDRAGIIYVPYDPRNPEKLADDLPPFMAEFVQRMESSPRVFDYYDERLPGLVSEMIAGAEREICLLQTNLETVNAHHIDDLRDALKRGVKVNILTLDPHSRYVNERALQLGYDTPTVKFYRGGLQNCIDNTATHLARTDGFRMRLYNDFPNQLTYRFDDEILASVISRTGRSRKNCVFRLPSCRLAGPKHTFVEHFDQLWENADQEINSQNWQAGWMKADAGTTSGN